MRSGPVTHVSLFICIAALCGAVPNRQIYTSSGASNIFIGVQTSRVNNNCISTLTIYGNGINKRVDYPCGKAPVGTINMGGRILVGDEWFSDQNNVLVHLIGNQCQREVFTEQYGNTSSATETLSDEECQKVHTKIYQLKEEQKKIQEQLAETEKAMNHVFDKLHGSFF